MTSSLHPETPFRLRVHVSEPFDFERENAVSDLYGWCLDCEGDGDEWEIKLEGSFQFNEVEYDRVLIGPRYVGEHLAKVHDALLGVPVRIAHRTRSGWHFAMTGMISPAPPSPPQDATDGSDPSGPDETTGS
ncbi:MAG TPA: hypothetical protein VF463_08945 [Sphingobium sp.]